MKRISRNHRILGLIGWSSAAPLALALAMTSTFSMAQSDNPGDNGSLEDTGPVTVLESHEEIWEYLITLCEKVPTDRCYKDDFYKMANGAAVEVGEIDESGAFHSKTELLKHLRTLEDGAE